MRQLLLLLCTTSESGQWLAGAPALGPNQESASDRSGCPHPASKPDSATQRLLAAIDDEEVARRYPNGTHFISANQPDHGAMATRALVDGDSVVLVFPDGNELFMTPEHASGIVRLFLPIAARLLQSRKHDVDGVQFLRACG